MASEHNTRVMLCTTTGHQAYCRRSAGPSHGRRRGPTHGRTAGRTADDALTSELTCTAYYGCDASHGTAR